MFFSIAVLLLGGLLAGWACKKITLPPLLGMMVVGMVVGPFVLNLLDLTLLALSADLRKIALIIILARAGLSLKISDLKQVGRPAILLCFVPALFEIVGMVLLAPPLLGISAVEALLLGTVIAAVSPAVIVPKMLTLMERGYGAKKGVPQLILAGAAVDDVLVVALFSGALLLADTGDFSASRLVQIPISILLGIGIGFGVGFLLGKLFCRVSMRDTVKLILVTSVALLFVALEDGGFFSFSALIATMAIGIALQQVSAKTAVRLAGKYQKLWVVAEILLFSLVGATVDPTQIVTAGFAVLLLLFLVLLFRSVGVWVSLLGSPLNGKERIFCVIGYLPKATVQAAIGGIPLSMGLQSGGLILAVAVVAIAVTAPLGAWLLDRCATRLLR